MKRAATVAIGWHAARGLGRAINSDMRVLDSRGDQPLRLIYLMGPVGFSSVVPPELTLLKDSVASCRGDGHGTGLGRIRTICGHQNHGPIIAAIDGVMNDRITSVSKSRPSPIVVPTCPATTRSLTIIVIMVNANTRPADVTTAPVPAIDRMMPVLIPAWISSLNLDTNNRL